MSSKTKRAIILWGGLTSIIGLDLYLSSLRRTRQNEILKAQQNIQDYYVHEADHPHEIIPQPDTDKMALLNRLKQALVVLWVLNLFFVEVSNIHLRGHTGIYCYLCLF